MFENLSRTPENAEETKTKLIDELNGLMNNDEEDVRIQKLAEFRAKINIFNEPP